MILTTQQLADAISDSFTKAREVVDFGFRDCDYFWRMVAIKMMENYPQVLCPVDAEDPGAESLAEAIVDELTPCGSYRPCDCNTREDAHCFNCGMAHNGEPCALGSMMTEASA